MDLYVVIVLLVVWTGFNLILKYGNKNKADYSYIVTFAYAIGFAYYYFYGLTDTLNFKYYTYSLIGFMIIILMFKIIISVFKKDITQADFMKLEKEMLALNDDLELLRKRFISTIEILNDGLCFKDEGEDFFGTDKFIEYFGLKNNVFSEEKLNEIIYKDDLVVYKNTLEKITKKKPIYSTTYRVIKDDELLWIKEVGRKIFLDKKTSIISIVKPLDIREYPESEIDVLNSLQSYKNMYQEVQDLVHAKTLFTILIIRLSNVPKINEKYGRDVGDLMMGEYMKKLRYNFIKDNHSLYRVGGINFALIVKDERKVELIDRALQHGGDLFNLTMVFGGITQTLFPNIGISEFNNEGENADTIIYEAMEALKVTLKDSFDDNYYYYNKSRHQK